METITISQFLDAFSAEWKAHLNDKHDALMTAYEREKLWTDYMLSYGGFLNGVMLRLRENVRRLEYSKEIYTIDAMFVGGEDLFKKDLCYPAQIHVLIEHEHGMNIEEEMWKLIFWRAPLKVLIFYDWNEDAKETEKRKDWLSNKLIKLKKMLDVANQRFPEADKTEYLFVIGNCQSVHGEQIGDGPLTIKCSRPPSSAADLRR